MPNDAAHPDWYWLRSDESRRARLINIRDSTSRILAINNLPYFTDHSVTHSDRLCELVDQLTAAIRDSGKALTPDEGFIIYCACYLHDIGMQFQNADSLTCIQRFLQNSPYAGQRWADLAIPTKRDILRDLHPRVSAEMVRASIGGARPVLGTVLRTEEFPGIIASLCESHGQSFGTEEYEQNTQPSGNIRTPLLAALLRIGDLLDESRRRVSITNISVVELDIESQTHWWRHYYTQDILFDADTKTITVWFEFPSDRHAEYKQLIPALQLPALREEFSNQHSVMLGNGIHWQLEHKFVPTNQSAAEIMPDDVQLAMAAQLSIRREQAHIADRAATLSQLKEFRPAVQRTLSTLRSEHQAGGPDLALQRAMQLAQQLSKMGGRREAWHTLWGLYKRWRESATPELAVNCALVLTRMMIDEGEARLAEQTLSDIRQVAATLSDSGQLSIGFLSQYAEASCECYKLGQAEAAMRELIERSTDPHEKRRWQYELGNSMFLRGMTSEAQDTVESTYADV